jgi:hypothetical protein
MQVTRGGRPATAGESPIRTGCIAVRSNMVAEATGTLVELRIAARRRGELAELPTVSPTPQPHCP